MIHPISTPGTVSQSEMSGTILDSSTAGKTISIDVERFIPGGVIADEGARVTKCKLHQRLRQGLRRDAAGKTVLTPIIRAADNLVSAVLSSDRMNVRKATLEFFNTRCKAMQQEFEKIAKVRNPRSAMLVGVCHYNDDVFVGSNYLDGKLSALKPWEIGLSGKTMHKLDLADGDCAILSRYPTTIVVPVRVTRVMDGSDDVVYLPVGSIVLNGNETSLTDLLEGDLDGDQYVIRVVETDKAKAELSEAFTKFWTGAEKLPLNRTMLTWLDHVEKHENPEQIAYQKCLSKSAVGSITLDFYAAFVHLMNLQAAGRNAELSLEDVRQLMTDSLESVFDLEHGQKSDPMALHSLMLGMVTFEQAKPSLAAQGLDIEKIGKLSALLHGQSVRRLACESLPFAVAHGTVDFNAVQRFINTAPAYKPLEFIAAMAAAKQRKSSLAADVIFAARRNATTLAERFRDRLFPTLQ